MRKSNFIKLLALLMTSVLLLAACGGATEEVKQEKAAATEEQTTTESTTEEKAEEKSSETVTITLGSSQNWVKDIDRELAKEFTEQTGIVVDIQVMPDDQYMNVMKSRLSTGDATDIFLIKSGIGAEQWIPEDNCYDLSDEDWVPRMKDWAINGATINGRLIGMNMWSVDGWGLLYNPHIFEELGLTIPTNTEEFMAVCEAVKEAGYLPVWENGKDAWHLQLWGDQMGGYLAAQNPGFVEGLNNNTVKYADVPELEQFYTDFKAVYDAGYFGEDVLAQTWEEGFEAMASGSAAMALVYTTWQNEAKSKFPESDIDTWEMFPIPLGGNDVMSFSSGGVIRAVNQKTENLEAVREFMNWMASEEIAQRFYDGRPGLGVPSLVDVEGSLTPAYSSVVENSAGGTGADAAGSVKYQPNQTVTQAIQEMFFGIKTPAEVVAFVDAERQKLFDTAE